MGSITSMSRKCGDGTDYGRCVSQGQLSLSAKNFSITTGKPNPRTKQTQILCEEGTLNMVTALEMIGTWVTHLLNWVE
jgi:hypothetical protein